MGFSPLNYNSDADYHKIDESEVDTQQMVDNLNNGALKYQKIIQSYGIRIEDLNKWTLSDDGKLVFSSEKMSLPAVKNSADGKDESQFQQTEYQTLTQKDKDSTKATKVYASRASEYTVIIPKTVILDAETRTGKYAVSVQGDIAGTEYVFATPDDTVNLQQNEKPDVTGTITQSIQKFYDDTLPDTLDEGSEHIKEDQQTVVDGTISAEKLTAGKWNGTFNFEVGIHRLSK